MVFMPEGVSNLWLHPDLIPDGLDQPGGWVSIEAIEETIRRNGGWVADPEPPKPTTSNILALRPRKLDL
jgi:hypothetical protein